jgi:transcriptional regulator GlxA family with amidase domain
VIALMDQHCAEPLSVADLARAVRLSPSYLTRLFQSEVGCAPGRFDRDRRLVRAYELVISTSLDVKAIMDATGFTDPSHFSREFKRRFDASAHALRARIVAQQGATARDRYAETEG